VLVFVTVRNQSGQGSEGDVLGEPLPLFCKEDDHGNDEEYVKEDVDSVGGVDRILESSISRSATTVERMLTEIVGRYARSL
jgi:hypothetical protein